MIDNVYKHSLLQNMQKKNENPFITSRNPGRDPRPCLVCKLDHCRQQLREFANFSKVKDELPPKIKHFFLGT